MRSILVAVAFIFLSVSVAPANSNSGITEILSGNKGELEWRLGEKKLAVVCFGTNLFKPYIRELYTLQGDNALRDSPPDHFHHHGLMYAIRMNGVNFWEEKGEPPGIEKVISLLDHSTGKNKSGLPEARCTLLLLWLSPTNRASSKEEDAFLIEKRTLTLTVDENTSEVAVDWNGEFQVGSNVGKLKLFGTDYNGLGMRLPESFDHVAKFQNSENAPYPGKVKQPGTKLEPTRNVIPARWSSVSGKIEQREIMVSLFGSPENRNGNFFFSLLDAFAYAGVTQALDQKPIELQPGDKYKLHYLVTVYSEPKNAEFLNHRYDSWQKAVVKR